MMRHIYILFPQRKVKRLFQKIVIFFVIAINSIPFVLFSPASQSPVRAAETTITKTTQADWAAGRFENKEIDIATNSGNLQLALDWGTWDASGPANINHAIGNPPATNSSGNSKVLKVNRYLYAFRNTSYGQFLRYDLDSREWKEMAYVPTQPYEVLDATTDGTSKIWAFATRANRKHFLEYDIATNTWAYLPNISDLLGQGATLEYVGGATSYIYAFRGVSTTDFFRYHINGAQAGTWQAIANPASPYGSATCGTYCDLTYDGSRYLYLVSDSAAPDRLYKYDTWSLGSAWPYTALSSNGLVGLGSDMVKAGSDYYMLATPGNGGAPQQAMYKYNGTVWSASVAPPYPLIYGSLTYEEESGKIIALTDIGNLMYFNPTDGKWSYPLKGPPLNTYNGNALITSNGSTEIYQCRGQNTATCYTYTIASNGWSAAKTYTTGALGDGSVMAYLNGSNYVGRGGSTSFYSVNPTTGAATALAVSSNSFAAGSAIAASGSANLYVLHGNSTVFRRYIVGTGWTTLTAFPETAGRGAGLARIGDFTYGTSGNFRGRFYRFSETANAWTEMASIPVAVYNGGAMTSDGSRYIYLQAGGENDMTGRNYYRYDSRTNTWERLADTPNMIRYGGGLTTAGGAMYSYQGYNSAFWKFTPKTTNNYVASGTWYSPEYDLTYASSFTTFSSSFTPAAGVSDSVLYYSRTSSNKNVWSDWELTDTTINSPAGRYIQFKAVLTGKADGSVTPIIDSFTFGYNDDTSAPVVTGLNLLAYSNSSKSTALTNGQTYNHRNPYFEWSSATDAESGTDGYYVYFGSNDALDPVTSGSFQQTTNYTVSSGLISGSTYYLKVKAKNKAGYSSASTDFSFVYQGISPVTTASISSQVDWDDAQATKSAVYTSSAGWWNQSYLYRQQLNISPAATATAGSIIRVTIDTAALVTADKLRSDRKDWRIIYSNGATLEEIDRDYVDSTTTYFSLKKSVNVGSSDSNYFVYYGNLNETTDPLSDLAHSYAASKWGSAMWYDGGTDYVRFNNATPFISSLSQLTVEGWFKYQNTNGTRSLYGSNVANQTAVNIPSGGNYLQYQVRTTASASVYSNNGTGYLVPNTWNHFALVYNSSNGTLKGFLNGRLDFTRTALTGTIVANQYQYIGYNATNGGYMYGFLDEYRISNTARYSTNFTPQTTPFSTDANTLGLYHFDEGSGQSIIDSSVNGNNGMVGSLVTADTNDPTWMGFVTAAPQVEEAAPISTNTSLMLQHSSNGLWANSKLPSLPWGENLLYGASAVAGDSLYVIRGNNTTTFYKLNLTTNQWTQLTELPAAAYYGSAMVWDGADSLYISRGNNTTDFYKYTISTDTFTTSPTINQPPNTFAYGATMIKGKDTSGNDVIYALRGNADDLYMYSLTGASAGSWSPKASAPYVAYYGAGLAYDSTSGSLWMLAGNGMGFAKYSIASDVWDSTVTAPALPPYYIAYASNNMFMYDNYLYTFTSVDIQANNESKNYIWRYNKTTDMWENIQTATEYWMYTGALSYDGSRYAYLINGEGSGQTSIARFDALSNSFYPETPNLPQDRLYTNNGERITHAVSTGTALASDNTDFVYMAQGATSNINRYQISTKRWTQLPMLPCLFQGNLVHTGTTLYAVCSNNTKKLYAYDEIQKQWNERADAPAVISNAGNQGATYDGSGALYVLQGNATTNLYKYTIATNSWTTESAAIPAAVGSAGGGNSLGASIQYYDAGANQYLYIFRGNTTNSLYRYKINAPSAWTNMSLLPDVLYQGSGSVLHNGKIYITTGFHNTQMYVYDIATDTYIRGINAPSHISAGGALVKGNGNTMYALQGNSQYTFWKYILPSATTAFIPTGTYTTKPLSTTDAYSFAGLTATIASPSATTTQFESRTSEDLVTWSNWTPLTNMKKLPSNVYEYSITSPISNYIQTRVSLSSDEGLSSSAVSNISINYYSDATPPTNPDTINSYTSSTKAATLTTEAWGNYHHPYFEWSGATDGTGSGISGYYVYFNTNPDADASVSGQLISVASYSATLATDGTEDGVYYLKIKAVDSAGNISPTHYSPFVYLYDASAPTTIASENVSVLPSGYTSTNNFTFSWIPTTDPLVHSTASGLLHYYYKTGTASGSLSSYQEYTGSCSLSACSLGSITAYQEGANTFYLKANDYAGNTSAITSINYNFNSIAPSAPRNVAVDNSNAAANRFSFTWDEPLTYRGTIKEYRYSVGVPPNASNISTTSARLVNNVRGTQDGENTFYVVAVDEANNVNYGNYTSKTFTVAISAPGIPLAPEAFDNSIRTTEQYRVGLTWDAPTDKGSAFDRYEVYASETEAECSTDMSTFVLAGSTAGTSYVATSIGETALLSQAYYFCIQACASTNQCSSPSTTITMTPTGRWLTAPDMVGSQSATVKTKTAIVSWNTDRTSNSFVKYGKSSGDYSTEVGSSVQTSYHEISITGLDPGTVYYYKMLWSDEDGNLGESDEKTFTTNPAPNVSTVKFSRVNITSAQVTFTIKSAIKATVQYGKTLSYGSIQSISTSKNETTYTIEVPSLLEGTIYHLRIAAEDDEGNFYYSDDYTFETLPTPKIIGLRLQQVVGMPTATVRLIWTTNTLASSVVTYYPSKVPQSAIDNVSLPLKKNHEVILKNLQDDTDYTIIVKGKDSTGNDATPETKTLKTANDMRAPEIQNLNVESTIIGVGEDARAQIVVSWDTDEPSTTQIEYGQGTGNTYNQTTQLDSNKTSNHIVTITGLSPSKIYHLRALSKDKADNTAQSLDTVIITPKSTKDALNLVIDNLSKTFGFLRVFIK